MTDPAPDNVDDLLARFGPKQKLPFGALQPHRLLIEGLRRKGGSFQTIFQVLKHKGVETSVTRLRDFCRDVLNEATPAEPHRKRGAALRQDSQSNVPVVAPPTQLALPGPASTPGPQPRERGPRIANVRFIERPKV